MRVLAWSATVVVLTWTASAHAAPPQLKGQYAVTGTAACLFAPGSSSSPPNPSNPTQNIDAGFNAALQPINPDQSFSTSFAVEGTRTFNGDGTGTVTGLEVSITVPPTPHGTLNPHFPPSAAAAMFSYSFTYAFNPDGSFSSSISGSLTGTFTAGPRTGQTFTVRGFPDFLGYSSNNSQTLTLANVPTPAVETITFSNGEVWPRICHRSRVLISLGH